jgi:uncharacterized protein YkwD
MNQKIISLLAVQVAAHNHASYDEAYNQMALEGHNHYRRQHQVNDLVFSEQAAISAQKYAEKLDRENLW